MQLFDFSFVTWQGVIASLLILGGFLYYGLIVAPKNAGKPVVEYETREIVLGEVLHGLIVDFLSLWWLAIGAFLLLGFMGIFAIFLTEFFTLCATRYSVASGFPAFIVSIAPLTALLFGAFLICSFFYWWLRQIRGIQRMIIHYSVVKKAENPQ